MMMSGSCSSASRPPSGVVTQSQSKQQNNSWAEGHHSACHERAWSPSECESMLSKSKAGQYVVYNDYCISSGTVPTTNPEGFSHIPAALTGAWRLVMLPCTLKPRTLHRERELHECLRRHKTASLLSTQPQHTSRQLGELGDSALPEAAWQWTHCQGT